MKKITSSLQTLVSFVDKSAKIILVVGVLAETLTFLSKRIKEVMGDDIKS